MIPLEFDRLVDTMNVYPGRNRTETFARLVVGEAVRLDGTARILDVGCGSGLSVNDQTGQTSLHSIRSCVGELWGCEPDPSVAPNPILSRFVPGTLESASLPESYFDVIYAHYVVEHVQDPKQFLQKAFRLLRPGGRFIFMTPNARHYFVRIAKMVAARGLERTILKGLHPDAAAAHYPTRYLLNEPTVIASLAHAAGFTNCEFAYFDHGDIRTYFPRMLRWIPASLEKVLISFGDPKRLPGLVVRLKK